MSGLDAGGDEYPNFAALNEADIRAYAERKAKEAAEERRALLRGVEGRIGSGSPNGEYRRVLLAILHAAGLLSDEAYEQMRAPVVITGGIKSTV